MISYEERLAQASSIHSQGLENVKNNPEPERQKFPVGSKVYITNDMPVYMSHFEHGVKATVEYTYAHAYGGTDSYSLIIDGKGSSAWYEENQLTLISEPD